MRIDYLLPLLAGLLYALSTILVKRALACGVGAMRITYITNWLLLPSFAWILIWDPAVNDPAYWWTAVVAGAIHFISVVLMFVAIRAGDVSVQTPVMGSKVIFVAIFTIVLGAGHVSIISWIAAGLSVIGVYILGKPEQWNLKELKSFLFTVGLSAGSALGFAITDVMASKYSILLGEGPFLVGTFAINAVASITLIPFFEGPLKAITREGWKWIASGVGLLLIVALMYFCTIAYYQDATSVNVLYSSRVIWSVVLVWLVGGLLGNNERDSAGSKAMTRRFIGASLLFSAIILVLVA